LGYKQLVIAAASLRRSESLFHRERGFIDSAKKRPRNVKKLSEAARHPVMAGLPPVETIQSNWLPAHFHTLQQMNKTRYQKVYQDGVATGCMPGKALFRSRSYHGRCPPRLASKSRNQTALAAA
jgi:hypothetical protein